MTIPADFEFSQANLELLIRDLTEEQIRELVDDLPPMAVNTLLSEVKAATVTGALPQTPLQQAHRLIPEFQERPHLTYLSERITQAVHDVENGIDRKLIVEMPPRMGKSLLTTQVTPAWLLARHPEWPIRLASYSEDLANSWGRTVKNWVADGKLGAHLEIPRDQSKVASWGTTAGGTFYSASTGQTATGTGAKVLIIDDPVKDSVEAHSPASRKRVWQWWLTVGFLRLQPPSLVIVIMTRWHEDDLVGRLLSRENEGDPEDWEVIRMPAIADGPDDLIGRSQGEPLLSPLVPETAEQAIDRWDKVKTTVGSYVWSAMYQQRPSPASGSVFDMSKFRYWTTDPSISDIRYGTLEAKDATTVLIDKDTLNSGRWLDSWDMSFKGSDDADYVVGQRWVKHKANRFLMDQTRGKWSFTQSLAQVEAWASTSSPWGHLVHQRLVEEKANGAAIINSLRDKVSGFKPINPRSGKTARALAITPEIESGNVFLPHPSETGYQWVPDLVDELREFDHGTHDDQVDCLTQALLEFRDAGGGGITVPGRRAGATAAVPKRGSINNRRITR